MTTAVEAVPSVLRAVIDQVFCDSKACAHYTLFLVAGSGNRLARRVMLAFAAGLIWTDHGFNGINVEWGRDELYLDPDWGPCDACECRPHRGDECPLYRRWKYNAYLQTQIWADRRAPVLERAGGLCEGCGTRPSFLEVHHLTYERLGNELPDDLRALCLGCHWIVHDPLLFGPISAEEFVAARRADPAYLRKVRQRFQRSSEPPL